MSISAPKHRADYPDRNIDCQMALELGVQQSVSFQSLLLLHDKALDVGWSSDEARSAILALIAANLAGVLGDEI